MRNQQTPGRYLLLKTQINVCKQTLLTRYSDCTSAPTVARIFPIQIPVTVINDISAPPILQTVQHTFRAIPLRNISPVLGKSLPEHCDS